MLVCLLRLAKFTYPAMELVAIEAIVSIVDQTLHIRHRQTSAMPSISLQSDGVNQELR